MLRRRDHISKRRDQHVGAVAGRIDPLLDHAGRILAAVSDVLGARAARARVLLEAGVIERVAPRHVGGVRAGQRGQRSVRPQRRAAIGGAKAIERRRGFRRAKQRTAAGKRQQQRQQLQRAWNFHRPGRPRLPVARPDVAILWRPPGVALLRHRHQLQHVTVGIGEIEAAAAAPIVELAVLEAPGRAAIGEPRLLDAAERWRRTRPC